MRLVSLWNKVQVQAKFTLKEKARWGEPSPHRGESTALWVSCRVFECALVLCLCDAGLSVPTHQARSDLLCTVGELTYIRRIEVLRV